VSLKVPGAGEHGRLAGRVVVATHNAGKLWEIRELLKRYDVDPVGAAELKLDEPEEKGLTFRDNATLKAQAAARACGLVALADDSGLCVEALGGAPGVYSARWAGEPRDFAAGHPGEKWDRSRIRPSRAAGRRGLRRSGPRRFRARHPARREPSR
jgi:Ham1 family